MTRRRQITLAGIVAAIAAVAGIAIVSPSHHQAHGPLYGIISPAPRSAPAVVTSPTMAGSAAAGATLTAGRGVYRNRPTRFLRQWQLCDSGGGSCADISGANASSYVIAGGDGGHTIRYTETVSNRKGSVTAATAVSGVVSGGTGAPSNIAAPAVAGTSAVGSTLTASTGSWSNSPISYSYQWVGCHHTFCTNLAGATASSYTLIPGQGGDTIKVQVTAINGSGASSPTASSVTASIDGSSRAQCSSSCSATTSGTSGEYPGEIRRTITSFADTTTQVCGDCTPFNVTTGTSHGIFDTYVPTGLVTNDSSHPVPLVILAVDGGFNTGGEEPDWQPVADSNRFVLATVTFRANPEITSAGAYRTYFINDPSAFPTQAKVCASSTGTSATHNWCDDVPYVQQVINYMTSHYSIDTSRIYYTGGSKAGWSTDEMMCDTTISTQFAGFAALSAPMQAQGTSSDNVNSPPAAYCPAANTTASQYHKFSALWVYSDLETGWPCASGTVPFNSGCINQQSNWAYSQQQQITKVLGPALGCTLSSPEVDGTLGTGSGARFAVWGGCDYGQKLGLMAYHVSCHGYEGCFGTAMGATPKVNVDPAVEIWNFWTTGSS